MKTLPLAMLMAAALSAANAFATDYTLAANTTTTAAGLKAASMTGSANTLFATNDNTHVIVDNTESGITYTFGNFTLGGSYGTDSESCSSLVISANTLSAPTMLTTSDAANSSSIIAMTGGGLSFAQGARITTGDHAATLMTLSGTAYVGGRFLQMNRLEGGVTTISMTDNARMVISRELTVIASNSLAVITLSGNATISTWRLSGGTANGVDWILDMSGNTSIISTTTSGNAGFSFGSGSGGSATITLSDAASMSSVLSFSMTAGSANTTSMTLKNTSLITVASSISSGAGANSVTTISVADTATMTAGTGIFLGSGSGSGTVVSLAGGAIRSAADFSLATGTNSQGVITVSGGTLSVSGAATIAGASGATAGIVVDSGYVQADSIILGAVSGANATLYISGGSVSATTVTVSSVSGATATLAIGANGLLSATSVALNSGAKTYLTSGADVTGAVTLNSGSSTTLSITGATAGTIETINLGGLTANTGSVVTIDFSGLTITGEGTYELLVLSSAATGLETVSVSITGYNTSLWNIDVDWYSSDTQLIATITAVPEPAIGALALGVLALVFVARRRR